LLLEAGAARGVRAVVQEEELHPKLGECIQKSMEEKGESLDEEELEDTIQKVINELTPAYVGKTPVEMAEEGIHVDIPQFVRDDPYEFEECVRRRIDIRRMFEVHVPRSEEPGTTLSLSEPEHRESVDALDFIDFSSSAH